MKRVSIVGATGYVGGELAALLARHPGVTLAGVFASPRNGSGGTPAAPKDGAAFSSLHPSLRGRQGPNVAPFSRAALRDGAPEVVFLATPNEVSAELVPGLLEDGTAVVDLSGSYRLRAAGQYPAWYGFTHPAPELLPRAVYGLTEWTNGSLPGARLVANPGCYPTAVALAMKPLLPFLEPGAPLICDAASGVSGAGKKSDIAYSFAERAGSFKVYGVGGHRHEPEMRQELGLPGDAPFVFVPHLLPVVRGILATLHAAFARPVRRAELEEAYESAYGKAPFVSLRASAELPELKDVVGTPRAEIGFVLLDGGRRAVVVSAIDNLLKGAASQAVQNLNRMCGWDESEGLS